MNTNPVGARGCPLFDHATCADGTPRALVAR